MSRLTGIAVWLQLSLKRKDMPFNAGNSGAYGALGADDLLDRPRRAKGETKATQMMQITDLFLLPMAKGRYDPSRRPYAKLLARQKLIDGRNLP